MDINSLPAGAVVLVDANIFIYYLGGLSAGCKAFLRRVALNRKRHEQHADRQEQADQMSYFLSVHFVVLLLVDD